MKNRIGLIATTVTIATVLLAGCSGGVSSLNQPSGAPASNSGGAITVGTANYTENVVLGYLYAGVLKAKGITATVKPNLGSREVIIPALQHGDIDLLPEYQGSLLAYLKPDAKQSSAEDVQQALAAALPAGLKVLPYAAAEDADVYAVTKATADKYNLHSLADLAAHNGQLVFGGPAEDQTRYAGIVGLQQVYGAQFKEFKALDADGPLTKGALGKGDIDVANLFSTDVDIERNGWVVLTDPKHLIAAQHIVPLINSAKQNPTVESALALLNDKLTTDALSNLDSKVDNDKADPDQVAADWLKQEGITS
ncbi:ABC transporter substrate-binding protein [Amycolatopsis sp. NPDC005003]